MALAIAKQVGTEVPAVESRCSVANPRGSFALRNGTFVNDVAVIMLS
jgi:hypothetical protein